MFALFILAMLSVSLINTSFIKNAEIDSLKFQCDTIDRALAQWSDYHQGIDKDTLLYDQDKDRIKYNKVRLYPETLSELKETSVGQGYFSEVIDLSKFRYSTEKSENGSMTYRLEVELPDGNTYVSRGSSSNP